jgi:hypothetical protein
MKKAKDYINKLFIVGKFLEIYHSKNDDDVVLFITLRPSI